MEIIRGTFKLWSNFLFIYTGNLFVLEQFVLNIYSIKEIKNWLPRKDINQLWFFLSVLRRCKESIFGWICTLSTVYHDLEFRLYYYIGNLDIWIFCSATGSKLKFYLVVYGLHMYSICSIYPWLDLKQTHCVMVLSKKGGT
jgi:hypothetical protein